MTGRSAVSILLPGVFVGVTLASATAITFVALRDRPSADPSRARADTSGDNAPTGIRDVRVLIADDIAGLRVRASGGCAWFGESGTQLGESAGDDWSAFSASPRGLCADGVPMSANTVTLSARSAEELIVAVSGEVDPPAEINYPGSLRISMREDGRIDVINEVDVERYLECVVASEAWPSFHIEAFRVQAIVSRTFVLYQMTRRPNAPFDVGATQGSQVYRGVRNDMVGQRAADAVRFTRGIACTYRQNDEDQLFCAYYSAACGGVSQSAAIFGLEGDIQPLSGGVECSYCRVAPRETYRWGPLRMTLRAIEERLLSRYPEFNNLGRLSSVDIAERTPSGRPLVMRLTGNTGQTKDLLAERFRFALGSSEFRSTDFELLKRGAEVVFENGRGFGHGLGLCQWGAQGQAEQGRRAAEIIAYYYPGAKLLRVY